MPATTGTDAALAAARNPGQLAAVQRHLERHESVAWCEPGYGWASNPTFAHGFLLAVTAAVLLGIAARARLRASERRPGPENPIHDILPQERADASP